MSNGLLPLLQDDPLAFVLVAAALIGAIALHEYAHALAADLQGDRMPRAMGRLSLNPARHLDPLGTLCIFLVGFGWGKPVEFRPQALSSKRFGGAIVALAGPMMNLLLAIVAAFVLVPVIRGGSGDGALYDFLRYFFSINVVLAVFNLVPLPPLDGSRLLTIFLPPSKQRVVYFLDRWGFIILVLLVFLGGITFLTPVIRWAGELILDLAGA
ncbi:MAG TPA: site-2 protease family protein [Actinomycetota bacterium]|jgi:Zn-dependent protease